MGCQLNERIIIAIEQAAAPRDGHPLTMTAAYDIAYDIGLRYLSEEAPHGPRPSNANIHSIILPSFDKARAVVAAQFKGVTLKALLLDLQAASLAFPATSGSSEPDWQSLVSNPESVEPWKLYAYACAMRVVARHRCNGDDGVVTHDDERQKLERGIQLLHFLSQGDISLGDLAGSGFDGVISGKSVVRASHHLAE